MAFLNDHNQKNVCLLLILNICRERGTFTMLPRYFLNGITSQMVCYDTTDVMIKVEYKKYSLDSFRY